MILQGQLAQRQEEFRSEEQDGQRPVKGQRAAHKAQTDLQRDEGSGRCGGPFHHQRGLEGSAQHIHRRVGITRADFLDACGLVFAAPKSFEGGQPLEHVQEVGAQPAHFQVTTFGEVPGTPADQRQAAAPGTARPPSTPASSMDRGPGPPAGPGPARVRPAACRLNWLRYSSSASTPSTAALTSSPLRSPRVKAGPRVKRWPTTRSRSACLDLAAGPLGEHIAGPNEAGPDEYEDQHQGQRRKDGPEGLTFDEDTVNRLAQQPRLGHIEPRRYKTGADAAVQEQAPGTAFQEYAPLDRHLQL